MQYETFTQEDAKATLLGRLRQLEGEHYGHSLIALEEQADSPAAPTTTHATLASLEARIGALRSLITNTPAAAQEGAVEAPAVADPAQDQAPVDSVAVEGHL